MSYRVAIEELQKNLKSLPADELPILLGELERLRALIWAEVMKPTETRDHKSESLLSMQEVAARLSIPVSKAYELVRQGRLQGVRVGKYVRVRPAVLEQYQAALVAA